MPSKARATTAGLPHRTSAYLLALGAALMLPAAAGAADPASGYGVPDQRPIYRDVRPRHDDAYRPPSSEPPPPAAAEPRPYGDAYTRHDRGVPPTERAYERAERAPPAAHEGRHQVGQPYTSEVAPPPPVAPMASTGLDRTYSMSEIRDTGHRFFGTISQGLASALEYAFQKAGRPNGYILGEDAGGAVFAGLRYGEGTLYTKDAGSHKVFWQGPSLGYDAGAEGSRVMVLVYNLRDPAEIYDRFGGVAGSAYVVGGVGLTFQSNQHVVLAPIRAGVGLRLGANIGYLKYTRSPTWNPF